MYVYLYVNWKGIVKRVWNLERKSRRKKGKGRGRRDGGRV